MVTESLSIRESVPRLQVADCMSVLHCHKCKALDTLLLSPWPHSLEAQRLSAPTEPPNSIFFPSVHSNKDGPEQNANLKKGLLFLLVEELLYLPMILESTVNFTLRSSSKTQNIFNLLAWNLSSTLQKVSFSAEVATVVATHVRGLSVPAQMVIPLPCCQRMMPSKDIVHQILNFFGFYWSQEQLTVSAVCVLIGS